MVSDIGVECPQHKTKRLAYMLASATRCNPEHGHRLAVKRAAPGSRVLLDELDLDNYHPSTSPEPICSGGSDRHSEAAAAYEERAAAMAPTDAERNFLRLAGRASR